MEEPGELQSTGSQSWTRRSDLRTRRTRYLLLQRQAPRASGLLGHVPSCPISFKSQPNPQPRAPPAALGPGPYPCRGLSFPGGSTLPCCTQRPRTLRQASVRGGGAGGRPPCGHRCSGARCAAPPRVPATPSPDPADLPRPGSLLPRQPRSECPLGPSPHLPSQVCLC